MAAAVEPQAQTQADSEPAAMAPAWTSTGRRFAEADTWGLAVLSVPVPPLLAVVADAVVVDGGG